MESYKNLGIILCSKETQENEIGKFSCWLDQSLQRNFFNIDKYGNKRKWCADIRNNISYRNEMFEKSIRPKKKKNQEVNVKYRKKRSYNASDK